MVDMCGRVLIIAGSDSGGGAGIQADIKTVTALGGFAMTAITALTAQNTQGVHGVHEVPADFVRDQIEVVLSDLGADCIKIGMLHRPEVILTVIGALNDLAPNVPIVADPVMIAKGGASLLADEAQDALKSKLLPMATLITPNIPEAEVLSGLSIQSLKDMQRAAEALIASGSNAVFLKGGHMDDPDIVTDLLLEDGGDIETFAAPRIATSNTHGTGCTVASAIACSIAQGHTIKESIIRARAYVRDAIRHNPELGHGHGPLNHAVTVRKFDG